MNDIETKMIHWEQVFAQQQQSCQTIKDFLGDNENAIKIQIWSALIANLMLEVVKHQVKKRKWAFSNIVSFARLHIFNYIHLFRFMENPEKDWEKELFTGQVNLFSDT